MVSNKPIQHMSKHAAGAVPGPTLAMTARPAKSSLCEHSELSYDLHLLPQPPEVELPEVLAIEKDLQDPGVFHWVNQASDMCTWCQLLCTGTASYREGFGKGPKAYRALVRIIEALNQLDNS